MEIRRFRHFAAAVSDGATPPPPARDADLYCEMSTEPEHITWRAMSLPDNPEDAHRSALTKILGRE